MSTQDEVRALWVSTRERIASFHEEAGYAALNRVCKVNSRVDEKTALLIV